MNMEVRNGIIILLTFSGGLLVGLGLQLNPSLIMGLTVWIATAVYGFLTRTRRLR